MGFIILLNLPNELVEHRRRVIQFFLGGGAVAPKNLIVQYSKGIYKTVLQGVLFLRPGGLSPLLPTPMLLRHSKMNIGWPNLVSILGRHNIFPLEPIISQSTPATVFRLIDVRFVFNLFATVLRPLRETPRRFRFRSIALAFLFGF